MKNVADGICASFPRFIHEVGVSFGHLKSAVSEPISYNELALSALGKPGCIGVSEGMKYNFLPPVCDAIIQAKFFHNCGKGIGNLPYGTACACRKDQVRRRTRRERGESLCHVRGHDSMASISAFCLADMDRHGGNIYIPPAEVSYFAKTQAAMQTDQRHKPSLIIAFF